jgi:uncharacterized protein
MPTTAMAVLRQQAVPWLGWMNLLHKEGIDDATGEVWLQAFPRVLGHAFKPVSFWYAHRADGSLAAIVAEVNNTFGERHCYLLPEPQYGQTMLAHKVFHVSPFCDVQGEYRFRFMRTSTRVKTASWRVWTMATPTAR